MGDDVDINTLTMEQYMALIHDNIRPGIVKLEIDGDVKFEINVNFLRELRCKLFKGLFSAWDLLEKVFIRKYCPPFKTAMKWKKPAISNKRWTRHCIMRGKDHSHNWYDEATTRKAQEDEGDMDDSWDITIKDIERLRKILIPTMHTLPNLEPMVQLCMPRGPVRDEVQVVKETKLEYDVPLQNGDMQYLTPQTVHIIPLDDDYVAPATRPILEKHLNEFGILKARKLNWRSSRLIIISFKYYYSDFRGNEVAQEALNGNSSHVTII
nr:hypothetical protein [Tanacetum cinerariifolium]